MDKQYEMALFGGDKPWDVSEWTASDDRVRGGKSQSYLIRANGENVNVAIFQGNLDIDTLGGAGFASQRTATETKVWDLSGYDGLKVVLRPLAFDNINYTLVVKDKLLPPNPNTGREQSTISYEADFVIEPDESMESTAVRVFDFENAFTANYRGKTVKDARPLRTNSIRRFSIMSRSHFGQQKGEFHLAIDCIAAVKITQDSADIVRKIYSAPTTGSSQQQPSILAAHFLAQRTEHLSSAMMTQSEIMGSSLAPPQRKYHTFPTPHFTDEPASEQRRAGRECCAKLIIVSFLCCIPLIMVCIQCLHDAFKRSQ